MKTLTTILLLIPFVCLGQNEQQIWNKANDFYDESQYDSALVYYDSLVLLKPHYAQYYFDRGNCYFAYSKFNKAIEDFDKGIALDSNNIQPYIQGAYCKYYLTDFNNALKDINKALEIEPGTDSYYIKNMINFRLGNYKEIIENSKTILSTDNSKYSFGAYNDLGKAYYYLKDYKQALEYFDKAIESLPKNGTAYFYKGRIFIEQGNTEEGYKFILKSHELKEDYEKSYLIWEKEW